MAKLQAGRNEWAKLKESPRAHRLFRWLRRKPFPHHLIGELDDGDEIKVVIGSNGRQRTWTDACKALLDCVHVQAFDAENNTLRVYEIDPDDPEHAAELEVERARKAGGGAVAGSVPLISVDVPKLVDNIASNLRDVARESAAAQAKAFGDGFAAMTSVVNLCLQLLVRVEQRLADAEDAATAARDTHGETATDGAPDPRNLLAAAALQKVMGQHGANGANGLPLDPNTIAALMRNFTNIAAAPEPPATES